MRVNLLGPIDVWRGGTRLRLREPRLQGVLGVLASRSDSVISRGELIDALWGDQPPRTAANAVHVYVARLRRILEPDRDKRAPARLLVWTGSGYQLRLAPDQVDVTVFESHRNRARQARVDGDDAAALRWYDAALGLWRGTPWCGVPGPFARAERVRLGELRLMVIESRAEVLLALGRHDELVAELNEHVTAHPVREHLRVLLMRALYASGRQAEALQVFRDTREVLVDELGIEPGPELQRLHQRILAADPTVTALGVSTRTKQAAPVPRQLPADVAHFTGRAPHLAEMHTLLGHDGRARPTVVIVAIVGTAGVGKTAVAVHFGHQVADRFPDGQLYVDLRGYAHCAPMATTEALSRLLRDLGLAPERVPIAEDEQAAMYRSMVAGKRMLMIFDNVRGAEQVRPLLPGSPGCAVVITSRTTLAGVDGVTHVRLDVLSEHEALSLLTRLAGPERVAAEPSAAAALVALCARLPLALRIAGARLAARPGWSIGTLVDRLSDTRRRLDELRVEDLAVRANFAVSYHALQTSDQPTDRTAARLFRLLGVPHWAQLSVPVAAALLDLPQADAHAALERLVDDHLLDSTTPRRYGMHDLLRLYANDLAERHEPESECRAALLRVLDCYLAAAQRATTLLHPGSIHVASRPTNGQPAGFALATPPDVIAWVDAERANLLAFAKQVATAHGETRALAVPFTAALTIPFDLRGHWENLITARGLAADVALHVGDRPGEALARHDVGLAHLRMGRTDEAVTTLRQALVIWREVGDRRGEQSCLSHLGLAHRRQQRFTEAIDCLRQSLIICREEGFRTAEGSALDHLGLVHQRMHRIEDAIDLHQQALAVVEDVGDRHGQASALLNLGWAHQRVGHVDEAITHHRQSLAIAREIGHRYQEAESLWGLGQAYQTHGHLDQARTCWRQSIAILHDIDELTDDEANTLLLQPIPAPPAIIQRST